MAKLTPARALILETLAAEIEAVKTSGVHLDALITRLEAEQGLKVTMRSARDLVKMRGVEGMSIDGPRAALVNWANAARRALLNGGQ